MLHLSPEQEARAARLHRESFVADFVPSAVEFFHLTPRVEARMRRELARGTPAFTIRSLMKEERATELEMDQGIREQMRRFWQETGVNCITVTVGGLTADWDPVVLDIPLWLRWLRVAGYARLVTSAAEMEAAWRDGQVGVILGLQDAAPIELSLERLDALWAHGFRVIQLTYNLRNLIGDGCLERTQAGLSHFGMQVVERMNDLGIAVDLSHCGSGTVLDAAALSRAPVCCTHTTCRALSGHPRGKDDAVLRAVGASGGYVGIAAIPFFLADTDGDPGLMSLADHVAHAAGIVGADKVGIGTDWGTMGLDMPAELRDGVKQAFSDKGFSADPRFRVGVRLGEFGYYRDWPHITRALVAEGFSDVEVQGILGGNFLAYRRRVEAAARTDAGAA